tara:strand:- start:464 stop:862 length:399 start_codon:yes stop_codon:yes gene_type:complete
MDSRGNINSEAKILKFSADWCGPCQNIKPQVEDLAKKYNFNLICVDVDATENQDLCSVYSVASIPYIVFLFRNTIVTDVKEASPEKIEKAFDTFHKYIMEQNVQNMEHKEKKKNQNVPIILKNAEYKKHGRD